MDVRLDLDDLDAIIRIARRLDWRAPESGYGGGQRGEPDPVDEDERRLLDDTDRLIRRERARPKPRAGGR